MPNRKKGSPDPYARDQAGETDIVQSMGAPRHWPSSDAMVSDCSAFIEQCKTTGLLPTVIGFCVSQNIVKDVFYATSEYYHDGYQKCRQMLEFGVTNPQAFGQSNPAMAIVQGKNTFKWDDSGRGGEQGRTQDIDFDAPEDEIDALMGTLGYAPKSLE